MSSSYCTYTDVQSEFKDIAFTTTTKITSTEVSGFISEASAIIDGVIGKKYTTPITGTTSLLILKYICINLVANRIKTILMIKSPSEAGNQENEKISDTTLLEMLNNIANGNIILSDAVKLVQGGIRGYNYDNDIDAVFDKETTQW